MTPATLLYALQILQALPSLIAAGRDVMALVNQGSVALQAMQAEKRGPTAAEWDALDSVIDDLRKSLHAK